MTTLREAAQQALEALELGYDSVKAEAARYHTAMAGFRPQRHAALDAEVEQLAAAITALRAALAQEQAETVKKREDFGHGVGADRFKVVRGAYWWHVLIGDGTTKHGKFHTQTGAEEMAALLLREFRNGAFVQHEAAQEQAEPDLSRCPQCNGPADNGFDRSFPPSPYLCTKCMAEPVEPVAKVELMTTGGNAGLATRIVEIDDHLRERLRPGQLLYTTPLRRTMVPLTDEEIDAEWHELDGEASALFKRVIRKFARAVEKASWEKNK